jgi:hypothetical protein
VSLDPSGMSALQSRLGSAQSSLAQAMAALATRVKLVWLETRGRTYIIAGLVILPLIWSFFASRMQTTLLSMLIAADVWVLGMCVFWNAREAFLPPVTIEELDSFIKPQPELPDENEPIKEAAPVPGTRGWYDHAFEAQSFAIPATLALMFLAIEFLVLKE